MEHPLGQTTFITAQMLDQFVDRFVPMAVEEVKSIKNGTSILNAADFAWPAKR